MAGAGRSLRRRWLLPGALALLLIGLAGSAGAYQAGRIPGVDRQIPPNAAPLLVTLEQPASGARYPANGYIPVLAKAVAYRPLAALELWADGMLAERKEMDAGSGSKQSTTYWSWRPGREGDHVLLVRAFDTAGAVAQSAPAHIRAIATADAGVRLTAQAGDTLQSLAAESGSSPEELAGLNPGLDPGQPITAGQEITVPLRLSASLPQPSPTPPLAIGPVQPAPAGPSKVSLWLKGKVSPPTALPKAPAVAAAAEGCNVRLVITPSSGQDGFFVYRLSPQAAAFERIATLGASGSGAIQYTDPGVGGHVEYYAAAFNALGEAPSNVVAADLGAGCLAPGWGNLPPANGLRIEDGKLITAEPLDRVYYYLSIDDGDWTRVPADPTAFVSPMTISELLDWVNTSDGKEGPQLVDDAGQGRVRVFDLAAPLGGLASLEGQHALSAEVWGWRGSELVALGESTSGLVVGAQLGGQSPVLSSATDLWMCGHAGACTEGLGWTNEVIVAWDAADQVREFQWSTAALLGEGGVWQVTLGEPFAPGFDPAPPGLIASGTVDGRGGTFDIDFRKLAGKDEGAGPAHIATPQGPLYAQPDAGPLGSQTQPGLSLLFGPFKLAGSPVITQSMGLLSTTLYVRVTPMNGNQPAGQPSPAMVVHYGPASAQENLIIPPPPPIHDVEIVGFEPVVFAHITYGTVEITRNDYYGKSPCDLTDVNCQLWSPWPPGTIVAPAPFKGIGEKPWYEQMFDFLKGIWDWAAKAYADLKKGLVDLVASTLPFCDSTCKALLNMGLNAALTSLGLPPDLPSLDQLSEMGEGYLISTLAEQAGVDCAEGSPCMDAIKAGIDTMKQAASAGGSNAACMDEATAHDHGIEPLCLPPGVVGKPAHGSRFEPARVLVKITRRADSPEVSEADYEKYRLHVYNYATNGQDLVGKTVTVPVNSVLMSGGLDCAYPDRAELPISEPLSAPPFDSASLPVPRLKPGESITIPVDLNIVPYWMPGHEELIKKAGGVVCFDDWNYLYFGGALTVDATIDCVSAGSGWVNCTNGFKVDSKQFTLPAKWTD